ncbi:MAG: hypothetical protein AAF519_04060 [Bacteroidota bacterium]
MKSYSAQNKNINSTPTLKETVASTNKSSKQFWKRIFMDKA